MDTAHSFAILPRVAIEMQTIITTEPSPSPTSSRKSNYADTGQRKFRRSTHRTTASSRASYLWTNSCHARSAPEIGARSRRELVDPDNRRKRNREGHYRPSVAFVLTLGERTVRQG